MNELVEPNESSSEPMNQSEIREIEGGFEVSIPHVELSSEEGPGVKLEIEIERVPIQISEGSIIGVMGGVIVDIESSPSPKLKEMVVKAKELTDLPEGERPRKIMEIVRSKVNYAYDEVVEELRKADPELADWVVKYTGLNSSGEKVKASEIVNSGHGICCHLAALAVILAKEAGLEASFETSFAMSKEEGFKNVARKDNGEKLFKSFELDEIFTIPHAWAEIRMSDGKWVPIDPSTKIVGDNDTELQTFKGANYKSTPYSMRIKNLPGGVSLMGNRDLQFSSGETVHSGMVTINCMPLLDLIRETKIPESYSGPLSFQIISQPTTDGMNVRVKSVKVIS